MHFCTTENPAQLLTDFIACLKVGAILAPIAPLASTESRESMAADLLALQSATRTSLNTGQPCLALRTSGTTDPAQQKTVLITAEMIHDQLEAHYRFPALRLETPHGPSRGCRLSVLPLWHAFGFVLDFLLGLRAGQDIIFTPSQSLKDLKSLLLTPHLPVRSLALVPRQIELLARILPESFRRGEVVLHTGGANLSASSHALGTKHFGGVVEGYGLTEAGPGVLLDGLPLPIHELRVAAEGGPLFLRRHRCGIFLSTPNETAQSEWLNTGDWAIPESGRIHIRGREGLMVKDASGLWMNLDELSSSIRKATPDLPPFGLRANSGVLECLYAWAPHQTARHHVLNILERKTSRSVQERFFDSDPTRFQQMFWTACEASRCKSVEDFLRQSVG